MGIHENSNKSYPSMVTLDQMALEYSIISQKIIHSFGIDKFSKLNIKRRYVDKSMFLCIWQRVSCTAFLLYTFSSHILV